MVGKEDELESDYYERAYENLVSYHGMEKNTLVDVFTDDPKWCLSNLNLPIGQVLTAQTAARDLSCFAMYSSLILSASTFSWWAANLTERPPATVFAPHPLSVAQPKLSGSIDWVKVNRNQTI
jgi:hypothetical protein